MILVPIVEKYGSMTSTEQKIADCILNEPEKTIEMTAAELSELTGTSPATVIRFARKLGFKSLSEMRVSLAKYLHGNCVLEKDMIIKANDTYENYAGKLLAQISDVCKATAEHINFAALSKILIKTCCSLFTSAKTSSLEHIVKLKSKSL